MEVTAVLLVDVPMESGANWYAALGVGLDDEEAGTATIGPVMVESDELASAEPGTEADQRPGPEHSGRNSAAWRTV
ncbi:hypothetical protein AAFN69_08115 [Streptomyces sp. CAU 1734]